MNWKKSYIRKSLIGLMLATTLTGCSSKEKSIENSQNESVDSNPVQQEKEEQNIFVTPEKAMEYFVENISKLDFEGALEVFPVEEVAKNRDFIKTLDSVNYWDFDQGIPNTTTDNILLNQNILSNMYTNEINHFIFEFFAKTNYKQELYISIEDEDAIESDVWKDFSTFDISDIKNLRIKKMYLANEEMQLSENIQKLYSEWANRNGGIIMEDYIIEYLLNEKRYIGGVTFIKCENGYHIWSLTSSLASIYGQLIYTEEEWMAR